MLFKIPNNLKHYIFSYILLLILPILPFIFGSKIQWGFHVLLLLTTIIESKKFIVSKFSSRMLLLIIPIIWSFYYTLNGQIYYVIQSLFYLLIPFILVLLGTQLTGMVSSKRDIYRYIVYSGTVGSLCYLMIGIFQLGMSIFTNIYMLRNLVLWSSITNVLTIFILLFCENYENIRIIKKKYTKNLILIVNIMALVFTASRTYYIIFLIFLLLLLLKYKKKIFALVGFVLIGCLIFVMSLSAEDNMMIYKIQNSFTEISNTRKNASYEEVNTYYRAYETQQALTTYTSGNSFEILFGHGLEKLIDLNIYIDLAGEMRRYIPVVHNGYAYLLLRLGLFGALFYFVFLVKSIFFIKKSYRKTFFYMIFLGTTIALVLSNYVVGTFFQLEMSFAWILLGVNLIFSANANKKITQ